MKKEYIGFVKKFEKHLKDFRAPVYNVPQYLSKTDREVDDRIF